MFKLAPCDRCCGLISTGQCCRSNGGVTRASLLYSGLRLTGYMGEKPSTVDEAIAYVWDVPDTEVLFCPKSRALGGHLETAAQTNRATRKND
ncbi:hypothetical protein WJX79_001101 [Trebouxia sp. C0005]